jgi:hypothetical protein
MLRWEGVFAHTEEKVKCHDNEMCSGLVSWCGRGIVTGGRCQINGMYREGYLGLRGWIPVSKGLKDVGKGQSHSGCGSGSAGIIVSLQHEGLCHVT